MNPKSKALNVLIIDGNKVQSKLLSESLINKKFTVEIANTLHEGIRLVEAKPFDAILIDLNLPDSTGLQTLYQLQSIVDHIAVVVLTELDDEEVALKALKQGAEDYLIKGQPSDISVARCLQYAAERHSIRKSLAESQRRTSLIIEHAHSAFVAIDKDGIITHWNRAAEEILGWTKAEIIGKKFSDTLLPERFGSGHKAALQRFIETGKTYMINRTVETVALHKDGHEVPLETAIFPVKIGENFNLCAFMRDITENKEMERRTKQLNEELERRVLERTEELARSNAELAQFAKIASHDLQEPLRTIQGYARLLAERYQGKLDKEAQEYIQYLLDSVERMTLLIQGVLAHSRLSFVSIRMEKTDTFQAVSEVLANLEQSIESSGTQIVVGDLPEVKAAKVHVTQLFQNLIGNAIKFRGEAPLIINIAASKQGDYWKFSVKDNGIGFDQKYGHRVFDMFSRLHPKSQYQGTGIGLAICKKITEIYNSKIWVESEIGKGTTFWFTLPAVN